MNIFNLLIITLITCTIPSCSSMNNQNKIFFAQWKNETMLKNRKKNTEFLNAVGQTNSASLESLINQESYKKQINKPICKDLNTPLHYAIIKANENLLYMKHIILLIDAGADLSIKNTNQKTPLDLANNQVKFQINYYKKKIKNTLQENKPETIEYQEKRAKDHDTKNWHPFDILGFLIPTKLSN